MAAYRIWDGESGKKEYFVSQYPPPPPNHHQIIITVIITTKYILYSVNPEKA